jgi:hypothetical protein
MPFDPLFMALAQAKSQPSHAFRDTMAALDIPSEALSGYMQGRQARMQIQQPEALARLMNATPQGHDIEQQIGPEAMTAAMYGSNPKEALDYLGKSTELAQRGQLGYAGINERNTASQRAYDAAQARTAAAQKMFGGKNLSSNIALHENEIQRLTGEQSRLASQVPGGVGGTIQALIGRGGDIGQYLQDPKVGAIAAQMKSNQQQIDFHKQVLQPMYRSQGIIPAGILDNSDMGAINPPENPTGGDTSQNGLPGLSF